jgi:hypothetical protein
MAIFIPENGKALLLLRKLHLPKRGEIFLSQNNINLFQQELQI